MPEEKAVKDMFKLVWLYVRATVDGWFGIDDVKYVAEIQAARREVADELLKVKAVYNDAVQNLVKVSNDEGRNASARATATFALKVLGQQVEHQDDLFINLTRKR